MAFNRAAPVGQQIVAEGTAHGGHLLGGRVWPTLEMIVTEMPVHLRRSYDDETGLALIRLAA